MKLILLVYKWVNVMIGYIDGNGNVLCILCILYMYKEQVW